jgi:hypothetical protein
MGEGGFHNVAGLLKRVLKERVWEERYCKQMSTIASFGSFAEFLHAKPPAGMGGRLESIRKLCAYDPEALDLLDRETLGKQGERTDLVYNVHEVKEKVERPAGNSQQAAIRRLRNDRPDLHAKVLSTDPGIHISANAAMIEAGFRKKPTPLERTQRDWLKLTRQDRVKFLAWTKDQD